jgi:hypothetical protein
MSISDRLREIHRSGRECAARRGFLPAGVFSEPPGPATVRQWCDFTADAVDGSTIVDVLANAARNLEAKPRAPRSRPSPESPLTGRSRDAARGPRWAPERVAAWRSCLEEQPLPAWIGQEADRADGGDDDPLGMVAVLGDVWDALANLDTRPGMLVVDTDGSWCLAGTGRIPATRLFHWQPTAVPAIRAIEEALSLVALRLRRVSENRLPASDYWTRPVVPFAETDAAADSPSTEHLLVDALARLALAADVLWALALVLKDRDNGRPDSGRRVARYARLLTASLAAAAVTGSLPAETSVSLSRLAPGSATEVGRRSLELRTPVRSTDLARFATGRLVRFPHAGSQDRLGARGSEPVLVGSDETIADLLPQSPRDPGPAFALRLASPVSRWQGRITPDAPAGRYLATLDPVVLTDNGVPRVVQGYSQGPGHAVWAAIHGCESFRIAEDGTIESWRRWPAPIVGELPWGTEGGAIAWTNGTGAFPDLSTPYLFWHRSACQEPERLDLPFRPGLGFVDSARAAWWSCFPGGIGRWSPDDGFLLMFPELSAWSARLEGAGICADPVARDGDGHIVRRRQARGWRMNPADRTLSDCALGPDGSTSCVARSARWTATVHPDSDLVRLDDGSGPSRLGLTCCFPLWAAWAGRSLVVATLEGELLFFTRLAELLDARALQPTAQEAAGGTHAGGGEL